MDLQLTGAVRQLRQRGGDAVNLEGLDRYRAVWHLAQVGGHVDKARALSRAWALFAESGVPEDPGWHAAAHALGEGQARATPAMDFARRLDMGHSGVAVWRGGVGSGRSYAGARLLWRQARLMSERSEGCMGRWADAPVLGMPGLWRDKGSTAKTWPEMRASLLRPHLLVLDDLGASGSTAAAYDRARELLEARFRSSKLTVVTTNVATPDLPKLLGGRVHSRAELHDVPGGDLRSHKLEEAPRVPLAVRRARVAVSAHDALDTSSRGRQDGERACAALESTMDTGEGWEQQLRDTKAMLAQRGQELEAKLEECIARMSGGDYTSEAEQERLEKEDARLRREHGEKLDRLWAAQAER